MSTRKFIYARVEVLFPRSPAAVAVGVAGVGWFTAGLCYCMEHRTDGFIPAAVAESLIPCAPEEGREYVRLMLQPTPGKDHGLWERAKGGYVVHDYTERNLTREQIEARSAAAKAANDVRWGRSDSDSGPVSDSDSDPVSGSDQNRTPKAIPTRTRTRSSRTTTTWKKALRVFRDLRVNGETVKRIATASATDEELYGLACDARTNPRVRKPGGWMVRRLQSEGKL